MKPNIKLGHIAIVLCAAIAPVVLAAQQASADPFIWLEDVDGQKSMDWVNAHNASTVAELSASPIYQSIYDRTKAILDSKDRIAYPRIVGDMLYNFWQDADHKRGIWRRTSWSDYTVGNPKWETVLDVDTLAKTENVTWSWGGADCFDPEERLCMVSLSRGGSDANEAREFDLKTGQFVKDGFRLPEAKMSLAWINANALLVGTDFGPGSMTTSGYARVIKQWKRGTPLSSATTVYETPAEHMGAFTGASDAGDRRYVVVYDNETFYKGTKSLYRDGRLIKLDIPGDADLYLVRDQMIVYVRDPWRVGGKTFGTGSLVAMPVDDFLAGKRDLKLVMQPGPRETINSIAATHDYLMIDVLNNVRGELRRYRNQNGAWSFEKVPAPDLGSLGVIANSPRSNRFFFFYTNFIQPTTLYLASEDGKVSEVKRLPAQFDAKGLTVEQLEATSKDGTGLPFYFFENTEGGHGAGVTNEQRAKSLALTFAYLWQQLSGAPNM